MKRSTKIISAVLCIALVFCLAEGVALNSYAVTKADIDRLKEQQASDEAILNAITERINELSRKIQQYNDKINSINNTISANNAEIEKNMAETEADKLAFKKRIRSIYMSNSESTVKILLGAKSFSQFLQLAQLTSSVSSHDKRLMEDLAEKIRVLDEKNAENKKLLEEQQAIKAELDKDYAELSGQQSEAQSIYDKTTSDLEAAQQAYDDEQRRMQMMAGAGGSFTGSGSFIWPSNYYYISAGYNSNDSVHNGVHHGIDIAGGGIMGTPIYAVADGYVTYATSGCPHNFGKNWSCGCGGGYGNYCQINHGTINGNRYSAVYAHATSIIVSAGQYVTQGQVIGYVGTTGWSTGPHLHFGLYENGYYVNPMNYF